MKNEKGFSLIVLILAVIIIFGIFFFLAPKDKEKGTSSIENSSFVDKPVRIYELAKDTQRKSELETLEKSLQLALLDGQIELVDTSGCNDCNSLKGSGAIDGTGWIKFKMLSGKKDISTFYPEKILYSDPDNTEDLYYSYYSDGNKFELNARLNSEDNKETMKNDRGNNDSLYEIGTSLFLIK